MTEETEDDADKPVGEPRKSVTPFWARQEQNRNPWTRMWELFPQGLSPLRQHLRYFSRYGTDRGGRVGKSLGGLND